MLIGYSYVQSLFSTFGLYGISEKSLFIQILCHALPYINYFSHMMLLAFLFGLLLSPLILLFNNLKILASFSVILFILIISFLLIDIYVFSIYQTHINQTLISTFSNFVLLDLSSKEKEWMFFIFLSILLFEIGIAFFATSLLKKIKLMTILKVIACNFILLFLSYGIVITSIMKGNYFFAQQTAVLPYYSQLFYFFTGQTGSRLGLNYFAEQRFAANFISHTPALNYASNKVSCALPKQPYNVILLTVDDLRYDSFNQAEMPHLFERKNQFKYFSNHWSSGNATQPGVFGLYYGLPPNYWYSALTYAVPPILTDKLIEAGYSLHAFWSSYINKPSFEENVYLHFKTRYSSLRETKKTYASDRDLDTSQRTIKFLQEKHTSPYFLHLHLDVVHAYCNDVKIAQPFQPVQYQCLRMFNRKSIIRARYYNRYRNSVVFADKRLNDIFKTLDKKKLWDNSIVIITSDHGEEFNDNDHKFWGHTSNYTKYQLKVPMLIHWPGKSNKKVRYKTTHYDFSKTLLSELLSCNVNDDTAGIGLNMFEPRKDSFHLAASYTNTGFVDKKRIFVMLGSGLILVQDETGKVLENESANPTILKEGIEQMSHFYQ
jgi:hypothetical protein